MDIKNCYALVTGSSSGLGFEFAKKLAEIGYNIVLTGRNIDNLEKNREILERDFRIKTVVIHCDLSIKDEVLNLKKKCDNLNVEVLINNAGLGLFGTIKDIDDKDVEQLLKLNILSLTLLSNMFSRDFIKKGRGYILNVGSMAGNQPTPYFTSYAASKSYVLNYSIALREEIKRYGVNVSCILPGYIKTNFDKNSKIDNDKYLKFSFKNSLSPDFVARKGLRVLFMKKPYKIIGFKNKLASLFTVFLNKKMQAKVIYNFITSIINKREL